MSEQPAGAALSERLTSLAWWRRTIIDGWSRPEIRWLTVILVLAAVLRIVWVIYAAREPQGLHDPIFYFFLGARIADGDGYTLIVDGTLAHTAYYPPGYSLALSSVFALVKYTPIPDNLVFTAAFFQVFLSVATVALVYGLGARLFNKTVGLVAAAWMAVFPNLIFHTATFLTETLFMFVVLAALLILLWDGWEAKRIVTWRLLAFAALLGFAILVRPIAALLVPALAVVWLTFGFGWQRTLAYAGTVVLVAFAVIVPWSIRNAIVMDAPLLVSANFGDNLCMGNSKNAPGHFWLPEGPGQCFDPLPYAGLSHEKFEVERNNDNTRRGLKFIVNNPGAELKLLSRKAFHLWESDHDGLWATESYGDDPFLRPNVRTALERIADIFFFTTISIGALGLAGLVTRPWDGRRVFLLLGLLAFAGVPLVFFGDSRFHVPVMPLLALTAAWAVVTFVRAVPGLVAERTVRSDGARTHGE